MVKRSKNREGEGATKSKKRELKEESKRKGVLMISPEDNGTQVKTQQQQQQANKKNLRQVLDEWD